MNHSATTRLALAMLSALLLAAVPQAQGQSESVLHSFTNNPDGATPSFVAPVLDMQGTLYGTTNYGGAYGYGTVFEVTSSGTEKILHNFNVNGKDGFYPEAGLARDAKGNLYGTTAEGGPDTIYGTVFKLTRTKKGWTETILHSFGASGDGSQPTAVPALDKAGNLYGTTFYGGASNFGTVFEVTSSGTEKVLWSFGTGADGANPLAGVILDTNRNCSGSAGNGEGTFSVSVDSAPSGRGFSRHGGLSSDDFLVVEHSARGLAPALLSIGSMSPTRLSLSMVASLQCPLPFHLAKSL